MALAIWPSPTTFQTGANFHPKKPWWIDKSAIRKHLAPFHWKIQVVPVQEKTLELELSVFFLLWHLKKKKQNRKSQDTCFGVASIKLYWMILYSTSMVVMVFSHPWMKRILTWSNPKFRGEEKLTKTIVGNLPLSHQSNSKPNIPERWALLVTSSKWSYAGPYQWVTGVLHSL